MKRLKSMLSVLLVIAMTLSIVYIPAMAATAPSISITGRILTDAEREEYEIEDTDVYGLFFRGDGGTDDAGAALGVMSMMAVFSYDPEAIQPYDYNNLEVAEIVNEDCFNVIGKYGSGKKDYYDSAPTKAVEDGARVVTKFGVYTTEVDEDYKAPQDLFVMFYKVLDASKLNSRTFIVDANAALVGESTSAILQTAEETATTYYFGEPVADYIEMSAPIRVYDGVENACPLTAPSVALTPVSGGMGGMTATVTDTNAEDMVKEYVVEIYNADGEKVDTVTSTAASIAIPESRVIVATESYTAIVKAVASESAQAAGYADSAFSTACEAATAGKADPYVKTVTVTGDSSASIPADDAADITVSYEAAVADQYGDPMEETVTWSIAPTVDGVKIENGVVTVSNAAKTAIADSQIFTVTAAVGEVEGTASLTVSRAKSVYTVEIISENAAKLEIPADDSTVSETYTATALDQYAASTAVVWSVSPAVTGVSISEEGVLTVTKAAADTIKNTTGMEFTVTAAVGDVADTATVTVARAGSEASSIKASGDTTVVVPLAGADNNSYTYTATVYDQYGEPMTVDGIEWSHTNANTGITVSDNTVTVAAGAGKAAFTMTATYGDLTDSVTVTPVDLVVDWTAVEAKIKAYEYIYGDADSAAGALGTGTATVGTINLTGTFSYANGAQVQDAGAKKIDIVFEVTAGDDESYIGTKVTYSVDVTIDQKELTVSWSNTTLVYNGTAQKPTASVDAADAGLTVSGEQTNAGTGYTATASITNTNYTLANPEVAFVINPKPLAVKWENTALTYTGKAQKPTASVETGVEMTVSGEETNAGTYTAKAALAVADSNYTLTGAETSYTIAPATISITTAAPAKSVQANVAADSAAALKAYMELPATVKVVADGMAETDAAITWADAAEAYDVKGATYTYVGTVAADGNYANQPTITATLTVEKVTLTGIATVPASLTQAKSAVLGAADMAALGVPASVTLSYDKADDAVVTAKWDKTLADLQAAAGKVTADKNQDVTITLLADVIPAWATYTMAMPAAVMTITNSFPVNVTFTTEVADATYGDALVTPVASATDAGNGLGAETAIQYYYKSAADTSDDLGSTTAPTDAGTYTCTAVYDNGTHYGKASHDFTIAPKALKVTWTNTSLTYTGEAQKPAASVETGAALTVTGEQTNVGTYSAKAALAVADGNYTLTEAETAYTIAKADRTVSITNEAMTLVKGSLTDTVTYTVSADADSSAAKNVTFSSSNDEIAMVNGSGKVTGVANGTVTITVTLAETANYNGATDTLTVTCVVEPITGITLPEGLTAEIDGTKIIISGVMDEDEALDIVADSIQTADGVEVTVNEDGTITVVVGETEITYTVDTDDVVTIPATVSVVEGAMVGAEGSTDGLADAVAQSVVDDAAKLLTEEQIAAGYVAQVTVYAKAEVAEDGASVDVAYYYVVDAVKADAETVSLKTETKLPALTQDITATMKAAEDYNTVKVGSTYAPVVNGSFTTAEAGTFELTNVEEKIVSITFTYNDGSTQTKSYTALDVGAELPVDATKSGFKGWKVNGDSTAYKTLTAELFAALTAENTAVSAFGSSGGGGGGGGAAAEVTYVITASAGNGGSITPSGKVEVVKGEDQSFAIKANAGYAIADVLVDGKSVGVVSTYTFEDVAKKHTIAVTFEKSDAVDVCDVFTDINESTWCHDAVQFVYDKGLMNGTTTTTFEPGKTLNRGMWVTMLYRMAGSPAVTGTSNFFDVDENTWCLDAILWGTQNGIINGFTDGTFRANDVVTRQQLVAILYRYAQFKGYDTTASAALTDFTDAADVWAVDAMEWALAEGILTGTTTTTLTPNGSANRGQAATFLMRFVTKVVE